MRSSREAEVIQQETLRVRAERLHLQRESQMLQMALEELQEENTNLMNAEQRTLQAISEQEQDLLRCLVEYAMRSSSASVSSEGALLSFRVMPESDAEASSSGATNTAESATGRLCTLIGTYEEHQNLITRNLERELQFSREAARQTRSEEAQQESNASSLISEQRSDAQKSIKFDNIESEVDLLHEMIEEVNQEIDALLLRYGSALFL